MSQAKKILESLVSLDKFSDPHLAPQDKKALEIFKSAGFDVKIESKGNKLEGTLSHHGEVAKFEINGENMYFHVPDMKIKTGHEDVAKALLAYMKTAGNHR